MATVPDIVTVSDRAPEGGAAEWGGLDGAVTVVGAGAGSSAGGSGGATGSLVVAGGASERTEGSSDGPALPGLPDPLGVEGGAVTTGRGGVAAGVGLVGVLGPADVGVVRADGSLLVGPVTGPFPVVVVVGAAGALVVVAVAPQMSLPESVNPLSTGTNCQS